MKVCLYTPPYHASALRPLYNYLEKIGQEVIWKTEKSETNADVYVTCQSEHRGLGFYDISKTIWIPHGLSPAELKCFPAHGIYRFKGALLSGQWYLDKIKEGCFEDFGKWNFLYPSNFFKVVGWMKGDILFSSEIDGIVKGYKEKLKLPYDKTVLYSPTGYWDRYSSFDRTINPLIDAVNSLEVNLIIKLHFATIMKEPNNSLYIHAKDKTVNSKNITWINYNEIEDITPLYKIADIMVTDGSSTALEFLQVNKPTIETIDRTYHITQTEEWRGHILPKGTTIQCLKSEDLKDLLMRTINYPNEFEKERLEWQKKLFYKLDGKVVERIWDSIKEMSEGRLKHKFKQLLKQRLISNLLVRMM